MLAGKILKGGSGNWGAIPMTAHATLSQADAELMVKYIMSLK
jgi:cytochrome c